MDVPPLVPDPALIANSEGDKRAMRRTQAAAWATLRESFGATTNAEAEAARTAYLARLGETH